MLFAEGSPSFKSSPRICSVPHVIFSAAMRGINATWSLPAEDARGFPSPETCAATPTETNHDANAVPCLVLRSKALVSSLSDGWKA